MRATNRSKGRIVKRAATGDTKGASEFERAEAYKRTEPYKRAVRRAYIEQPVEQRRRIVKAVKKRPSAEGVGLEQTVIEREHTKRAVRRRELDRSAATKDTKGDTDRGRGRAESERNLRAARIEYLRRTRKQLGAGDVLAQVKKELEGRGEIAKGAAKLGSKAVRGSSSGKAMSSLGIDPEKEIGGRLAKDLINLPAQVVPSLYIPAAGVVEAAKGRPERIKKLGRDIQEGDPLYKLGEAGVALAKGDTRKAGRAYKRAKELASEHPGFTLAEAFGVRGTAGRGAGRVARKVSKGKVGSTVREPRILPGTKIEERRSYSPDIITKQEQKLAERLRRDKADDLRQKAQRAADPDERDRLLQEASQKDPSRMPGHAIQRRVDERVDANETVRRVHRAEAVNEARKVVKKVKAPQRPLVNLVAQGIVRADADDIRAYLGDLEREFDSLGPVAKRQNTVLRRQIEKALNSKDLDLDHVRETARRYQETTAPLEKQLIKHGLIDTEQAERARLIPYAVRRMGAKHQRDKNGMERIVGPDGDLLTVEQIRSHMKESGQAEPAFLSQSPNARGARNFYISSARAPSIGTAKRTGEATRKGTFDAHPDTLIEQAARARGLVDAHEGFGGFVDEFSLRSKSGKVKGFTTKTAAIKAAKRRMVDDLGEPIAGAHEFVPVRINPFGGSKGQLQHLLEDVSVDSQTQVSHQAILGALEDALAGKGSEEGQWALIPKAAADRMAEHLRVLKPGEAGKILGAVNSAFRRTVLATSPAWFTGNVVEGVVRAGLAKAGPRSYATGRKVIRRIPEAERGEAIARLLPGGHFGSAERQRIHRDVSQFAGTRSEPFVRTLAKFWRAPGPKQAADLWHHWTTFVFHSVNGGIEQQIQTAMLGAEVRRSPLMDGQTRKLSEKAIQQAADGLRNTNEQVAFGRAVDVMYGKYGKWSPDMRKAIALYTPFVAWTLNATRFVAQTLPRDHPTTLAVIAAAEQATEEWRKQHGLDKFMTNAVPGWLQGSIPGNHGEKFRVSRFTPFGAFGDLGGTLAGNLLPQFTGPLLALQGRDWKGNPIRVDGHEPDDITKAMIAGRRFLEATVPLLATGQRVAKKGPGEFVSDAVTGRVAPRRKKAARKATAGRIVGPGGSGGRIVGPGSGSGRIVP